MALYDAPVHRGYMILTHTQHPLFQKNGFKQIGNTTIPANNVQKSTITKSALYNKNLNGVKGISEAGYGQRMPYRGLSYAGAGSPPSSVYRPGMSGVSYAGAGSPRSSVSLKYAGAGSPPSSVYRPGMSGVGYSGAGSPRASVLRDAYINDNPPPNSLKVLPPAKMLNRVGNVGEEVSPATDFGTPMPSTNIWSDLSSAVGSLFNSAVQAGTQAGSTAINSAITGTPSYVPAALSAPLTTLNNTRILGMSGTTFLFLGAAGAAFYMLRK